MTLVKFDVVLPKHLMHLIPLLLPTVQIDINERPPYDLISAWGDATSPELDIGHHHFFEC